MKLTFPASCPMSAALMFVLIAGCSGFSHRQASADRNADKRVQPAPVELRLTDHYEWIKRLIASDPVEQGIQQVAFNPGSRLTYAVPLSPQHAAAGQYFLIVDQQAGLVWLQSSGWGGAQETHGPWKTTQPDAAHLLHSITTPPTTQTAAAPAGPGSVGRT
ncbi:MAG: hypothetical protein R3C49_08335 [Planctomycetaceae bacterium]